MRKIYLLIGLTIIITLSILLFSGDNTQAGYITKANASSKMISRTTDSKICDCPKVSSINYDRGSYRTATKEKTKLRFSLQTVRFVETEEIQCEVESTNSYYSMDNIVRRLFGPSVESCSCGGTKGSGGPVHDLYVPKPEIRGLETVAGCKPYVEPVIDSCGCRYIPVDMGCRCREISN